VNSGRGSEWKQLKWWWITRYF